MTAAAWFGEIVPMLHGEPSGLDDGVQPVGCRQVADSGVVGPGKWIIEFALTGGDVPHGELPLGGHHPTRFLV
jgi:hypothetical protein